MTKIIAITNQKGGVGKTTTTLNLASSLGALGKKILLIDMDPQGNATTGVGIDKGSIKKCIYNVLVDEEDIKNTIIRTQFKNLDVVPARIHLSGADLELSQVEARELRLKNALMKLPPMYDYVFFDCPPSLGLLTLNALTAAQTLIIPIQAEYYALEGVSQLLNTIRLVQRHLNPKLTIDGIVLTMTTNTNLSTEIEQEVRQLFEKKVYKTTITRGIRLSEAPSHGLPIIYYDSRSRGAEEYVLLAREVIAHG